MGRKKRRVKIQNDAIISGDTSSSIYLGKSGMTVYEPTYGTKPSYSELIYMDEKEPVAAKITSEVANDIFGAWFKIKSVNADVDDEEVNHLFQNEFKRLSLKEVLTRACHYERRDGTSFIVLGFDDGDLESPVKPDSKLVELDVYPFKDYEEKKNDQTKLGEENYPLPSYYTFRQSNFNMIRLHYSRVIPVAIRFSDHKWQGYSLLARIWDDLVNYRAIRYGVAQGMLRWGTGIPTIKFPRGTTKDKMTDVYDNQIGNLNARTFFLLAEPMDLEFKGIGGVSLNPEPYEHIILKNIAMGTDIPIPILEGAMTGYATSSEINERKYFRMIENQQSKYESFIRRIINYLIPNIPSIPNNFEYKIIWNTPFKLTETQRARAERLLAQANELALEFMTVNEVRSKVGLPEIEGGDIILSIERLKAAAYGSMTQNRRVKRGGVREGEKAE